MRIAYLNTKYPSLSHTFIEREIRAVREAGVEVHTFSIRRPGAADRLGPLHEQAARDTFYLLDGVVPLVLSLLGWLFARPHRLILGLIASQRLSPPGPKARLLHLAYLAEATRLAAELKRRSICHLHVHMANNGAAVALLATRLDPRIQYSLSIHGSAEFFHVDSWCLAKKVESATFVRCISHFCRSQIMAWTSPAVWDRLHIIHCGIDPDAFGPRPPRRSGPLRILTVGRLDPIKGYPMLLDACNRLDAWGVEWRLEMVGDGPLRPLLEKQIQQLQLEKRVKLLGAVGQDRIQDHFDSADVMVVSSFMEGVPVVLMEAMAKRLAVIATRVGGIPELIDDQISGILVTPGSVGELSSALWRLAQTPALIGSLAIPAREKIVREFAVEHVGREMARLFEHYCASPAGADALAQQQTMPPAPRTSRAWARPTAAIRVKA